MIYFKEHKESIQLFNQTQNTETQYLITILLKYINKHILMLKYLMETLLLNIMNVMKLFIKT